VYGGPRVIRTVSYQNIGRRRRGEEERTRSRHKSKPSKQPSQAFCIMSPQTLTSIPSTNNAVSISVKASFQSQEVLSLVNTKWQGRKTFQPKHAVSSTPSLGEILDNVDTQEPVDSMQMLMDAYDAITVEDDNRIEMEQARLCWA
jgi:hypothetical protein